MTLTDTFWEKYELDLQEVKLAYLNWAIGYAKEPSPEYWHLFLWDIENSFWPVCNSRYGRSFGYGTLLYHKTKNLRLVQKQLGHSSITTTTVYADVLIEETLEAVNGLFDEDKGNSPAPEPVLPSFTQQLV